MWVIIFKLQITIYDRQTKKSKLTEEGFFKQEYEGHNFGGGRERFWFDECYPNFGAFYSSWQIPLQSLTPLYIHMVAKIDPP